jgi:uncharacterized protein YndB with AHSA1/START domain
MHPLTPALAALALLAPLTLQAEVVASSDTHFVLSQQASSPLGQAALWERLIHPERWWSGAHSYSGDAANLSLDPRAGGLWREDWDGGSVVHGRVLLVQTGRVLRLEAPFGPLQPLGAYTVWTITLEAEGEGSRVSFHEVASAPPGSDLATLAGAVDAVKSEAIGRLARP